MIYLILFFFIVVISLEVLLIYLTKFVKKKFQWIINTTDEKPLISNSKIENFLKNSYDSDLGWIRKPNTQGKERSNLNESFFNIDNNGSRTNPININLNYDILTYGDSFTFCRQVNDNETWQFYLSKKISKNISNFGVGNYGIDQAHLLCKRHQINNKVVIFGVVPETILRIHSFWKHYLEYGNLLAFKPRYIIKNNELKLIKNKIVEKKLYSTYFEYLNYIQENDSFYEPKFKKHLVKFPYLLSYCLNLKRNYELLFKIILSSIFQILNIKNNILNNLHKKYVIDENTKLASKFYKDNSKNILLKKIIEKIHEDLSIKRNKFVLLILPQYSDLNFVKKNDYIYYKSFINSLSDQIDVIDLTQKFLDLRNPEEYFVNDRYGGHMNKNGNYLISEEVQKFLKLKKIIN